MQAGGGRRARFRSKTVRIVVPYPAGGGTDVLGAHHLADQLSRKWKQTVLVENIGGAAGNIGAADVFTRRARRPHAAGDLARAGRDQQIPLQGHAVRSRALDPDRAAGDRPLRADDAQEFRRLDGQGLVAHAKANPGKITSATPGVGSVGHLATVELEMLAGIKTVQVPYRA